MAGLASTSTSTRSISGVSWGQPRSIPTTLRRMTGRMGRCATPPTSTRGPVDAPDPAGPAGGALRRAAGRPGRRAGEEATLADKLLPLPYRHGQRWTGAGLSGPLLATGRV